MDFNTICSGVVIAVLSTLIVDYIRTAKKKAKKAPSWVKDLLRFLFGLAVCIYYSVQGALAYGNNPILFALSVCAVIMSALGLCVLFFSYRIAFDGVYDLSEKLLDYRGQEVSKNRTDKHS